METNDLNGDLRPEYDLTKLKLRRVGEGRKQINQIQLDVDVAWVFPDPDAANAEFRTLIRIAEQHKSEVISK